MSSKAEKRRLRVEAKASRDARARVTARAKPLVDRALAGQPSLVALPAMRAAIAAEVSESVIAARLAARQMQAAALWARFGMEGHPPPSLLTTIDYTRATRAASRVADVFAGSSITWTNDVQKALASGEDLAGERTLLIDLTSATMNRLDMTIATEMTDATSLETFSLIAVFAPAAVTEEVFRWNAVLDRATCPACGELDGKRGPLRVFFGARPPLHVRCRCFLEIVPS